MLLSLLPLAAAEEASDVYTRSLQWHEERVASQPPLVPEHAWQQAFAGTPATGLELVAGSETGKAWGLAVFDLRVETLWKAVTDAGNSARFLPVRYSEVIASPRQDGALIFQMMSLPVVSNRWWCVRQEHNGALYNSSSKQVWELAWHEQRDGACNAGTESYREEAVELLWNAGSWMLIALSEGRTAVEYYSWSHPGGKLPAEQISRFAASRVVQTMEGLAEMARWEESSRATGFYRPDGQPL